VVIVNSGFNKALIGTDYNNRVDECKIAASVLQELTHGKISAYRDAKLRNIDPADWAAHRDELPGRFGRRAKHFFTEIDRVRRGVEAWKAGDLAAFGRLMVESGRARCTTTSAAVPSYSTIFDVMKTCPGIYGAGSAALATGLLHRLADPSAKAELERRLAAVYPVKHPQFADKYRFISARRDGAAVAEQRPNRQEGSAMKCVLLAAATRRGCIR
jgi:galactokinase